MIVISHRGYWKTGAEKNTKVAFERSFSLGFGTETDLRDAGGRIVISHDAPSGGEMTIDQLIDLRKGSHLPLALNIKADGLGKMIADCARARACDFGDWFVFDMSIPDMRVYFEMGAPVFTRMSEVERVPAWLDRAVGVWLDAFEGTWYGDGELRDLLETGKRVCIVSSELHRRPHVALWALLKPFQDHPNLLLCTDRPEEAQAFFPQSLPRPKE